MDSKRGISYKWRYFLPTVGALWVIIIGMAFWHVYSVSKLKLDMVYDQLELIGNYIPAIYADNRSPQPFINFVNDFYRESHHYDQMTIQVIDVANGTVEREIGLDLPDRLDLPAGRSGKAEINIPATQQRKAYNQKYLFYRSYTNDRDKEVLVLLPYTRTLSETISAGTTRFWLIFVGIAVLSTVMAYISSVFVARNIRILTHFASQAATNPHFISDTESIEFPNDELGDTCRQIMVIYNQRIEEMERSEREHQVALNAIKEKDRIKRELTGNINHELKTPVGVIQGYLDTLVDTPDMDIDTQYRMLVKAQEYCHRLSQLINDVTAVTRLESGGKLVNVDDLNYHDVVFEFASEMGQEGIFGPMKFRFNIPINCNVYANRGLLESMLLNLVKNAVKYSHGTEMVLECTGEDQDFYHFAFYDDGVGVPPEHLPHLFERFYRVNAGRSRDMGGTGLGLAIIEVTIQTFGGTISVNNRLPQGLQFDFTLPKHNLKA